MKRLDDLGFINVERLPVDSDEDKDEVVEQSVAFNTEIDVTAKIVLSVSKGPKETTPPTEKPTEPPTEPTTEPTEATEATEVTEATEATEPTTEPTAAAETTKVVQISLPEREEAYVLSLFCDGQMVREATQINPGTKQIEVALTGSGTKEYVIKINGEYYQSFKVDF